MRLLNDKATIIIRSVGERTEQLCRDLILAQGVAPTNVIIVREAPFSAALRKSFEIGLKRGLPWTFCVDADLLLRPNSIVTMLQLAENHEKNVCQIQGYILDKFFGGPRYGGVHLYRTSLLPLTLTKIPPEGKDVRPETHTLNAMAEAGYPWVTVPYLVGLHDFEQSYQDIFRKSFVQAHKHLKWADLFLTICRERADSDKDYHVALHAFATGLVYDGDVYIDIQQDVYQSQFAALDLVEKQPLLSDSYTPKAIEEIITTWIEPGLYLRRFPNKMGLVMPTSEKPLSIKEKLNRQKKRLGYIKMIPYILGWFLTKMGTNLQALINPESETHPLP